MERLACLTDKYKEYDNTHVGLERFAQRSTTVTADT